MPDSGTPADPVELVRRSLVARPDEFPALFTADVRLDLSVRVFNPAVFEGYEGLQRYRSEALEVWDSYVIEPEEFHVGQGVVVVFTREVGRGGGSGVEVDRHTALLFAIREGRVCGIRLYHEREQALRDAGLAE